MQRISVIAKLFLLLLIIYFLMRVVFGIVYFSNEHFKNTDLLEVFYWGARLDFAALFYINIAFFVFCLAISPLKSLELQKKILLILFSIINLPFIALNFIDLVYYQYNLRRSTTDIFLVLGGSIHSFATLFKQYWFVVLVFIIVALLFIIITKKVLRKLKPHEPGRPFMPWLALILVIAVSFALSRGFSNRPIGPNSSLLYVHPKFQPLVNNSTLNILDSYLRATTQIQKKNYFTQTKLDSIYSVSRQYRHTASLQKRNIVIFVLESFSAGCLEAGAEKAQTPFFDSLLNISTVCTNSYENGHESTKGLSAILVSVTPFLDEPIFMSNYSSLDFNGIGSILKDEGYSTNFFHGAEYDHFNFAKLCKMTGIDQYYSKDTYKHPQHDDGNWGIYDEFFFDYFAQAVSQKKQPFFSVLYNISSHPPFAFPSEKKKEFTIPGQSAQLNSITYVDNCFKELFANISRQPWYNNTLFVFIADHNLTPKNNQALMTRSLRIPFFIHDPKKPQKTIITKTAQQLDVVPTVLDMINYSRPFVSFGNSVFRNDEGFSICRINGVYQLIDSLTVTGFDEMSNKVVYHYAHGKDGNLTNDRYKSDSFSIQKNSDRIKAIIQRFNNSLINHSFLP